MELHPIQKHILRLLSTQRSLPFAKLKPSRVEGNQFTYHLKKLQRRGYVRKSGRSYALTTQGMQYSTRVNFEYFSERIQPKIVTLIACKNARGEFLMYRRGKQPFLGMIGFPYGKIHLGEKVADAAHRDFHEKTGATATLKQKGIMYLLVRDAEGEVIIHMICHVFAGVLKDMSGTPERQMGEIVWMSEKEIRSSNCMPGVDAVLKVAKRPGTALQFEELEYTAA